MSGQLPDGLNGCHFGNDLISFILYQYHHQHVTQPLLLKQLLDLGVEISSGRLSQFITDDLDMFHDEKDHTYKPDCPSRRISIPMTPERVMTARTAIAPILAMSCLLGLVARKAKAALTSSVV
ncbi:MAG: hypothetical protein Q8N96_09330 [Methylovulum sp.]|nr:hypothetical protein [Methylovulum sp.]